MPIEETTSAPDVVRAEDHAPDWAAADAPQLVCPLCDYNLRGLAEPRCPECGYQFTWRGLIEQRGLEHPYLFEHHARRRPIGSFVHTLLATALPLRFWRTLRPGHEPNLRRLVVYWIVVALLGAVLLPVLPITTNVVGWLLTNNWYRNAVLASPQSYLGADRYQRIVKSYGSVQNYVNATMPVKTVNWRTVVEVLDVMRQDDPAFLVVGWYLLVPLFAAASLSIFRESLRQARLRTIHVLRVAVYSWSMALVVAAVLTPVVAYAMVRADVFTGAWGFSDIRAFTIIGGFLLAVVLPAISVIIASRRYLAIPRATLTAVLSQLLAILAIGKLTQAWMWSKWW